MSLNEWLSDSFADQPFQELHISSASVIRYYGGHKNLFEAALDAVATGCVTKYYVDIEKRKLIGSVVSSEEGGIYKVEVCMIKIKIKS